MKIASFPDKAELDPNLLSEVKTILCGDHGASLLAKQQACEIDPVVTMQYVADEMRRFLSEHLRAHVKEAMHQLAEEPDLAEFDEGF